jgi:chemotaxis protein methyltransferase CheR
MQSEALSVAPGRAMAGGEPELGEADFRRFADLVYAASGIHLTDPKRDLLRARLRKRLKALGIGSFKEYFNVVSAQGAEDELAALLDAVSTNKTEFFREAQHFDHLAQVVVPEFLASAAAGRGEPLRVWSAACSSGEEVYSLAMTLDEALGGRAGFKVLGTDISIRMLSRASAGAYEDRLAAAIPSALRQRYFEAVDTGRPRDAGAWVATARIRDRVTFGRLNLNVDAFAFQNPLDAVFCRNAMIYFDRPTQEALVAKISATLKPGGWLYTGLAESLIGIRHDLAPGGPSVYRKRPAKA